MAITETLALNDQVTSPAVKMAAAMARLDQASGKAAGAIGAAGMSGGKFSKQTQAAIREADAARKALDKLRAPLPKLGQAASKAAENVKKLDEKDALGALVGGTAGTAILTVAAGVAFIGTAAVKATGAVVDLATAFGKALVETHNEQSAAKALFDTLSGGRGAEVLARLQTQSIATGQSLDDLKKSTAAARDAGLDFGDAFELNKLRGDMIATGKSTEQADAIIAKTLADIKSGAVPASKAIAGLTDEFSKGERGAKAVDKASNTLGGALDRVKAAGKNMLLKIDAKAGPALDKIGTAITKVLDKFDQSGQSGKLIDAIASAVMGLADAIIFLLPYAGQVADAIESATSGDWSKMSTGGKVVTVLAAALAAVAITGGIVAGAVLLVIASVAAIPAAMALAAAAIGTLGGKALAAGGALVTGLVDGIKNGASKAVAAAKELADKVGAAIKSALQIGSPSKLTARYGVDTGRGMAMGLEQVTPSVGRAAMAMGATVANDVTPAAAGTTPASVASAAGGAAAGGSPTVNITINVTAAPGASKADGEALAAGMVPMIRREVTQQLEVLLIQRGAA